jgi:hypothetical protein
LTRRTTQFDDALSVLSLQDLDELDEEDRKILAELMGLELKERGYRSHKGYTTSGMVTKSGAGPDASAFYQGPPLASPRLTMVNKGQAQAGLGLHELCRLTVGLPDRMTKAEFDRYEAMHPEPMSIRAACSAMPWHGFVYGPRAMLRRGYPLL